MSRSQGLSTVATKSSARIHWPTAWLRRGMSARAVHNLAIQQFSRLTRAWLRRGPSHFRGDMQARMTPACHLCFAQNVSVTSTTLGHGGRIVASAPGRPESFAITSAAKLLNPLSPRDPPDPAKYDKLSSVNRCLKSYARHCGHAPLSGTNTIRPLRSPRNYSPPQGIRPGTFLAKSIKTSQVGGARA